MLCLFMVLILGRSNDGIFNKCVHKLHSIGTEAALENGLAYNLDTENKLPAISVLTKPDGGKEMTFNWKRLTRE